MSRVLSVGVAAALSTALLPAGTAAAATSASCGPGSTSREFTIDTTPGNKIAVDQSQPGKVLICFTVPYLLIGGGVVVIDTQAGSTLPVTQGTDDTQCRTTVLGSPDEPSFNIAIDIARAMVCLTFEGEAHTFAVNTTPPTVPSIQIWRDGTFGWVDVAACPVEWLEYQEASGPGTCMTTNARIV